MIDRPVQEERTHSFGQSRQPTIVDRFGIWLGTVEVRRHASFECPRYADLGCGYDASFARTQLDAASAVTLVDFVLADDLLRHPKVQGIQGSLLEVLPGLESQSFDVITALSVVEHLWEPEPVLGEIRRLLAPGGVAILNVPAWLGKPFLEFNSFRLGMSPVDEIDDHKRYYDPKDLWPMLVRVGFRPRHIRCHRHKFGLNTSAICRVPAQPSPAET